MSIYTIENFLDIEKANTFHNMITGIPDHWWSIAVHPANMMSEIKFYVDMNINANMEYHQSKQFALNTYYNGDFAYHMHRDINNHYDNCYCGICKIKEHFKSDEIKSKLSNIVGENVVDYGYNFVSKYIEGDFLSIHDDKGNGDYAFIYQLTKDWNPSHGGLLHFCENNVVIRTDTPKFNNMTIFKITDSEPLDHFVSNVTGKGERYAYTGWFNVEK
jgi:Rps23 Pro-64 3,4-dihydroxylase Tpa1-like proline 4-hydroxylase